VKRISLLYLAGFASGKSAVRRQFRGLGGAAVLLLLQLPGAFLFCYSASLSAQTNEFEFEIHGNQALSQALIQFSHQSGLAIVFPDQLARNIRIDGLQGEMSPEQALGQLLANTDLDYRLIDNRIIAVYDARCELTDSCPAPEEMLIRNPLYVPGIEELYVYGSQTTGSRIRRNYFRGSAPVDIISSPDIELSGAQTLGELLRRLPAVSGNPTSTLISNGGDGRSTVTLRGMPASSTLVLINGRRVANHGLSGEAIDLNSIAPAAVERIEVLKDGASAIYGSDAIAGVINIIMKRDFYGALIEQFYGSSQRHDGETTTTTLQYGTGFRHGSLFISGSHFDQSEIHARDRSISRNADSRNRGGSDLRSSATPSARIALPTGDTVILDEESGQYRAVGPDDLYNFPDLASALVPSKRDFAYINASYDFTERVSGTIESSYTSTRARSNQAPTPVFTAFEQIPLIVAADNKYNPFGVEIEDLRKRLLELPPRRQDNKTEVARIAAVLQGLHWGWDWELSHSWSRSKAREHNRGLVNADHLQRGIGPAADCQSLAIDGCIPVNLFGLPGAVDSLQQDYLEVTGKVIGESKLSSYSFTAARKLWEVPHGVVDFAFGVEYRDESTSEKPDQRLSTGSTIGGTNFQATQGKRDATEIYAESIAPVWRSANQQQQLDIELAVRYSSYSDFGNISTPKYGMRFQITPGLMLRATHAQGFRAPNLTELHQGKTEAQAFINDPCTLLSNVGRLPGCTQQADPTRNQFLTVTGGNPQLDPEKSRSYGAGLVWTSGSIDGLSATIDYFDIETSEVVDSSAQFLVDQNATFERFEDRVTRDDQGNLQLVTATKLNVGTRRVQGADGRLTYRLPRRNWGQLSTDLNLSYIDEYTLQLDRTAATVDLAGTFRDPASEGLGGIPQWKGNLGLQWARQRWRGSYEIHFVSKMDEQVPSSERTRVIDSWMVQDVQFSYVFNLLNGLRVSLGIDNLTDTEPPFAASAFNDNYDARNHDLKGRFWYAKLSQRL
jgi:iron complex outermembrane receptor protein